jgi:uncharacterized protein YndB with AHSA1/START domain
LEAPAVALGTFGLGRIMKRLCLAFAAALLLTAPALAADPPTPPAAERLVQTSMVIDASAAELWKGLTDGAAYRRWAGGAAAIDLRIGGVFEASYEPTGHIGDPANLKHRIVAFTPERLLVFQNIQAPGLPGEALYRNSCIVVQYEPLGKSRTRVTVTHVGLGAGPAYDGLAAFFGAADPGMLKTMKAFYEKRR